MAGRLSHKPDRGADWLLPRQQEGMAAVIRELDWAETPLGPLMDWPQSLRTCVNLCLVSPFPTAIIWGSQRTQIYNDSYHDICALALGEGHAIGGDFKHCRQEKWKRTEGALADCWAGDVRELHGERFFLNHFDKNLQEHFYTSVFRPVPDESGQIGGVFHSLLETTAESLAARRQQVLRDLARESATANSLDEACENMSRTLRAAVADIPFALFYEHNEADESARLITSLGLQPGAPYCPRECDLSVSGAPVWPLRDVAQTGEVVQVDNLGEKFPGFHCGPYPEAPQTALVLPIYMAGMPKPHCMVVAGVSARLPLDESYRTFFTLLRESLGNILTKAHSRDERAWQETQRALRRSEQRYRAIVESQTEMLGRYRPDGTITFINAAYARARELTPEDIIGRSIWELIDESYHHRVKQILDGIDLDQPEARVELPLAGVEPQRWILWISRGLDFDENGRPREYQSFGIDITERRKAEEALRRKEELLRLAFRGGHAGAWAYDLDGDRLSWGDEIYALYGFSSALQPSFGEWLNAVHPEDRENVEKGFRVRRESGGDDYRQEYRILHPQKGTRWILGMGRFQRDGEGRAREICGIDIDITERKHGEEALAASEQRFRTLAEAVPTIVWAAAPNGAITYLNKRWSDFTGQSTADALRFGWVRMLHPEDRRGALNQWRRCLEEQRVFEGDVRYRRRDGRYHWHHFKGLPLQEENGEVNGWYGASLDIEDHKRAEQLLRKSEQHFRQLADTAPAMLWMTDPRGDCTFVSRAWLDFTGQSEEESLGSGWLEAVHPDDRQQSRTVAEVVIRKQRPLSIDHRLRTADGEYRWVNDTARPRFDAAGCYQGHIGSAIDIHERKQAEETLREREEHFHTLADNISQFAWMSGADGKLFWFNRRWYEYTGDTPEASEGWGWTRLIHPDHREQVLSKLRRCCNSGEAWEDIFPLRSRTGEYRWFLSRALPIRDEQGQISRWFGTNTDITAQREAEEALRDADRRKNEFLATLAHELRNPLAPLRNGLEILQLVQDDPDAFEEARTMMERQLRHMVRLIDDLLDLSRISRGKIALHKQQVALATILREAVETSRPTIETRSHQLSVELPRRTIYVEADPVRLGQVFSNLLNNAAKFTDRGGNIWLSTEEREGEVAVSVRDNGIGISGTMLAQVFEMFTQAESVLDHGHGGLGIGLSLVKGLVDLHGGRIDVHSDGPGLGSEFVVTLPITEDRQENGTKDSDEPLAPRGNRILVVDDNRDSASSMATMLELMDNETRSAYDGLEALGVAAAYRPDMVFLDIGMPKLNGYEVARKVREHHWGQQMILVALTGWGQEEDRRRSQETGFDYHLVKPVTLSAVQKILSGERNIPEAL